MNILKLQKYFNIYKNCMHKIYKLNTILSLLAYFLIFPTKGYLQQSAINQVSSEQQITPTMLLEYETKLEQERTKYVQEQILDKIFGPNRSTVMIDITLGLRTTTTKQQATAKKIDAKRKLGETEFLLPGIPKPGSIAESSVPAEAKGESSGTEVVGVNTEIVIQKQNVTVVYDEKIKDEKVEIARESIAAALDIKKKESIIFKKARFKNYIWEKFFENIILPKYLIPFVITLLLLLFLFGPVAEFLRSYIRMLRERSPTEISIDSKLAHEGEGIPSSSAATQGVGSLGGATIGEVPPEEEKKEKEEEEKYVPFSYVNDDNIKRLIYLLVKEKPEDIAIVLSYLKPEYVKEILESFKPELQSEVAIALSQPREVPREEIIRIDSYIKERIDFLVGGIHRLVEILNKMEPTIRKSILTYLEHKKPEIYQKIRPSLFLFEDIVDMPDIALQTVIRELKPENIARALRNAPKNLIDKFFKNMSEGAQALVKEEIDYGKPMTKEQIEEEQNKIVDLIKKLEQEGKIYVRESEKTFLVDKDDVITLQPQRENSLDFDYYSQGLELYQQGDYENAIAYLQFAIELNPQLVEAYQCLGNIYYELKQYQLALEYYKKVVELVPQDKEFAAWVEEFEKSISVSI